LLRERLTRVSQDYLPITRKPTASKTRKLSSGGVEHIEQVSSTSIVDRGLMKSQSAKLPRSPTSTVSSSEGTSELRKGNLFKKLAEVTNSTFLNNLSVSGNHKIAGNFSSSGLSSFPKDVARRSRSSDFTNESSDLEEGEIRDSDEPEENEAANDSTLENPIQATLYRSTAERFQQDRIDDSGESDANNYRPSQTSSGDEGLLSMGGKSLDDLVPIQNSFLCLFIQLKPEFNDVDRIVKFILDQVSIN